MTDTSTEAVERRPCRHVTLDHDAKIAWAMSGDTALASFAFEAWGGANKASMAAQTYLAETEQSRAELVLERDALKAEVERLREEGRREERERCAKLVEDRITGNGIKSGRDLECEEIAAAIRAQEGGE